MDESESVHTSPPWGRTTKIMVAVATLILLALTARYFSVLIKQVVVAVIIAYLLNPLISLLDQRTALKRSQAILLVYLLLLAAVIGGLVALGFAAYNQINNLIEAFPTIVTEVTNFVQRLSTRTWTLGPLMLDFSRINWLGVRDQILNLVQPALSTSGDVIGQIAGTTVTTVVQFFFIYVVSIYLANDFPTFGGLVSRLASQPGYSQDAERLVTEFGRIWRAYLRGQIILGLIIGLTVWLGLTILGVQNALALGLLSGLMEFLPVVGPFIGVTTAVIVTLFQPENWLNLAPWQHALAVLALMLLIQQVENNILVPRIVGTALDLHALTVMVGVIMGASVAGVLGAVLAAPLVATLKLLGYYAWRKMFDLPPFPHPPRPDDTPGLSLRRRVRDVAQSVWQRLRPRATPESPGR